MTVAVELHVSGGTLEQYDRVVEKMGFSPGGSGAPGGLFHWVMRTDDGIRVVEVWWTKEDFERFARERIGPITQEVGVTEPPEIRFYDVHNSLTEG